MKTIKILIPFLGMFALPILWGCSTPNDDEQTVCSWQVVFSDDYQRPDGQIGSNYSFQVSTGGGAAADIFSNRLRIMGTGYWAIRYVNPVTGDIQRVSMIYEGKANTNIMVAAKSRDLGGSWQQQEFYAAVANDSILSIQKCQGAQPQILAWVDFPVVQGHLIRLEILVDNDVITVAAEDLTAGVKKVLSFTDTGTLCIGTTVSINGCCMIDDEAILVDDFKVEACK
jgi:hypothetical protein